jgi:hypothetical protein
MTLHPTEEETAMGESAFRKAVGRFIFGSRRNLCPQGLTCHCQLPSSAQKRLIGRHQFEGVTAGTE